MTPVFSRYAAKRWRMSEPEMRAFSTSALSRGLDQLKCGKPETIRLQEPIRFNITEYLDRQRAESSGKFDTRAFVFCFSLKSEMIEVKFSKPGTLSSLFPYAFRRKLLLCHRTLPVSSFARLLVEDHHRYSSENRAGGDQQTEPEVLTKK